MQQPQCGTSRRAVAEDRADLQQPVGADVEERLFEGFDDLVDVARRVRGRQEEQMDTNLLVSPLSEVKLTNSAKIGVVVRLFSIPGEGGLCRPGNGLWGLSWAIIGHALLCLHHRQHR